MSEMRLVHLEWEGGKSRRMNEGSLMPLTAWTREGDHSRVSTGPGKESPFGGWTCRGGMEKKTRRARGLREWVTEAGRKAGKASRWENVERRAKNRKGLNKLRKRADGARGRAG